MARISTKKLTINHHSKKSAKILCPKGTLKGGYMCVASMLADSSVIADLKCGDEVIVEHYYGYPPAPAHLQLVVVRTNGYSALLSDGTQLSCMDGYGVKPTGVKKAVNVPARLISLILPRQAGAILRLIFYGPGYPSKLENQ